MHTCIYTYIHTWTDKHLCLSKEIGKRKNAKTNKQFNMNTLTLITNQE